MDKACEGHTTITDGDMEKCCHCGIKIRWDLVEHPFFGFKNSCLGNNNQPTNTKEDI